MPAQLKKARWVRKISSVGTWDANAYGDLIFSKEQADVEASGKLATKWGSLKMR